MPLVFLWLGLFPGLAGPTAAWALLLVSLSANTVLYRKHLVSLPSVSKRLKVATSVHDKRFLVLLLAILSFQMISLTGLWVTPGDDAKLYSLITDRFIETRGIPQDWGIFANPSWYAERTHLLLPGFSGTIASLVFLTGFEVPSAVSVVASIFRSLAAGTLYVLALTMTRRQAPAFLTMAIYGLIIVDPPVSWFVWGGQAELSAIMILPVAVAATFAFGATSERSWRILLWASILIGGMSLLHPFAIFYYLAFLLAVTLISLWRHQAARGLVSWLPALLGLGLASGPILHAFPAEISISGQYSSIPNPAWTPTLGWSNSAAQAAANIAFRIITVYGLAATVLLFAGLMAYQGSPRLRKDLVAILATWFGFLFLLHENNPNGLLLIPFPLWYRIDSNRTFSVTSVVVAILVGMTLEQSLRRLVRRARVPRMAIFRQHQWLGPRGFRLAAIGLILILLPTQLVWNGAILYGARTASPVSLDDVAAFSWIQSNTPSNATFFVNWADAGTWIPVYTGRRVVMPFGVLTNYTLLENYTMALKVFIAHPDNSTSVRFIRSTGVTYIYAGPSRIYGRPGFNATQILSIGQTKGLYSLAYKVGQVWIFQVSLGNSP